MSASFLWLDLQKEEAIDEILREEPPFLIQVVIMSMCSLQGPSAPNCPSAEIKGDSGTEAR